MFSRRIAVDAPSILGVCKRLIASSTLRHAFTISPKVVNPEMVMEESLDFENNRPFHNKKAKDLLRSLIIFKLCSYDGVVNNAERAFLIGRRFVPSSIFGHIMGTTFYGHFTAGSDVTSSRPTIAQLHEEGIKTMLMIPIENVFDDVGEREECFEKNFLTVLGCVDLIARLEPNGFSQLKITSLEDVQFYRTLNKFLIDFEKNHEEPGDWSIEKIFKLIQQKRFQDISISDLNEKENTRFRNLIQKLDAICQRGQDLDIHVMIDAEQTYIQAALGYVVLLMQAVYNKEKCIVFNTYQCYRKDNLERVKADRRLGDSLGFKIAGKFVRGAYMIEERELASKLDHEDPINESYEKTGEMYHACADYVLPGIKNDELKFMFATHNEQTVQYIAKRLSDHGIDKQNENYCFAQIYGMCDHVSVTLGRNGYHIFKSVPVGTIDDTLLYLTRRAIENKSVLWRTFKERSVIRKEISQRIMGK